MSGKCNTFKQLVVTSKIIKPSQHQAITSVQKCSITKDRN